MAQGTLCSAELCGAGKELCKLRRLTLGLKWVGKNDTRFEQIKLLFSAVLWDRSSFKL